MDLDSIISKISSDLLNLEEERKRKSNRASSDEGIQLWNYYPKFFPSNWYEELYSDIKDKVSGYFTMASRGEVGKLYPSNRLSCFFMDSDKNNEQNDEKNNEKSNVEKFSYSELPVFDWKDSPMITKIRLNVQLKLSERYDYCLCHIYRDGKDNINFHSDKEALDSDIASVSFGAQRKFRLRSLDKTKGYDFEYLLGNGDLFHMLAGCQRKYKHAIPKELTIKEPRINLTFRKFSK